MNSTLQSLAQTMLLGLQGWMLGALASGIFFVMLWLTLERASLTPRPIRLLALSFGLRMALLLGVFTGLATYGSGAGFERLLGGLLGFLSVRQWAIGRCRPTPSVLSTSPAGDIGSDASQDRFT